jgi:hypothetical protein
VTPGVGDAASRRGRAAAVAAVLLGVVLRAAVAFPVHKYAADADCLNSGLVALRVAEGHFPVWYTPRRIGSLECYIHAAAFPFLGVSRAALAVAPLLSASLLLAAWAALALLLLGPVAGPIAVLLVALPPPAYLFWTYMPNAYPETMLLFGAILLLAELVRREPGRAPVLAAFGLAMGLGWWNSLQTLSASGPAVVWLVATRGRALRNRRALALVAAGFAAGAFPWIAWNVRHPLGSFRENFAVRPASGLSGAAENVAYLVRYSLPELVATTDPENGVNPPSPLQTALRPAALAIWGVAALAGVGGVLAAARRGARGAPAPPWLLLALSALAALALATISDAGARRGLTVRYVLPLLLPLAAALAGLLAAGARRVRGGAAIGALAVGLLLVFNVSGYFLPGSAARRRWEEGRDADARLVAFLDEQGIDVVCGDYWSSYPVNFLSKEKVRAVPFERDVDFYGYEPAMPDIPHRWAVVGHSYEGLERLAARAGFSGAIAKLGEEQFAFVPEENPPNTPTTNELLRRFRDAFFSP